MLAVLLVSHQLGILPPLLDGRMRKGQEGRPDGQVVIQGYQFNRAYVDFVIGHQYVLKVGFGSRICRSTARRSS